VGKKCYRRETLGLVFINIIAEGQTEEEFVNKILAPFFGEKQIFLRVRCVETGKKNGKTFRGGMTKSGYEKVKRDILNWMKEDRDAWYTTMFDLYKLPTNFPGFNNVIDNDPYKRVESLENSMQKDIQDSLPSGKFIPYFQLHEYEALLFAEPRKLDVYYFDRSKEIQRLIKLGEDYQSPEHINHDSAPSKRIIAEIPEYYRNKTTAGPIIAQAIGLENMRIKCKHFSEWLSRLESLM
jgi:hypothetical protein